jgi:hypothetical protein
MLFTTCLYIFAYISKYSQIVYAYAHPLQKQLLQNTALCKFYKDKCIDEWFVLLVGRL